MSAKKKVQDWGVVGKALARMMGARGMISFLRGLR